MEVACFVATVAYGSPMEPRVKELRAFRDQVLAKSAAGKAFIDLYYEHGASVAAAVADSGGVKAVLRGLLLPVLGFARVLLFLV
jgi:hypothetical protein